MTRLHWAARYGAAILAASTLVLSAFPARAEKMEAEKAPEELAFLRMSAMPHPLLGTKVPDLRLKTLRGRREGLRPKKDKALFYVILDPRQLASRKLMPKVNELTVNARRRGMDLVCVFHDAGPQRSKHFFWDKGIVAHVLRDPKGKLAKEWKCQEIPFSVAADPDGNIIYASEALPTIR